MDKAPFIHDFNPPVGVAQEITAGVRRLLAPNASAMTFRGTNTYILGESDIAVIDPGPDDPAHLAALLDAIGPAQRIGHILVTHSHVDHSPLARRLSRLADAPVLALGDSYQGRSPLMTALSQRADLGGGEGMDAGFSPDICLPDGGRLRTREWEVEAIATPGHFSNHLCFALEGAGDVFSGDHVMSWATTLVSAPDGDLGAFMASLDKMQARSGDRRYFPGHGAVLDAPHEMISYQINHRRHREAQILAALADGPARAIDLAERIYTDISPALIPAAARNVFSHLIDLTAKHAVTTDDPLRPDSRFALEQDQP